MLEGVPDLTLDQLNDISQPWIELEYNRKVHSEIDATPLQRFLGGKSVAQSCRSTEELQLAFTKEVRRTQRRSHYPTTPTSAQAKNLTSSRRAIAWPVGVVAANTCYLEGAPRSIAS